MDADAGSMKSQETMRVALRWLSGMLWRRLQRDLTQLIGCWWARMDADVRCAGHTKRMQTGFRWLQHACTPKISRHLRVWRVQTRAGERERQEQSAREIATRHADELTAAEQKHHGESEAAYMLLEASMAAQTRDTTQGVALRWLRRVLVRSVKGEFAKRLEVWRMAMQLEKQERHRNGQESTMQRQPAAEHQAIQEVPPCSCMT
jgi:hypothetical protein